MLELELEPTGLVVDIRYLDKEWGAPQLPSFRVASIKSLEVFRTSTLS